VSRDFSNNVVITKYGLVISDDESHNVDDDTIIVYDVSVCSDDYTV